MTAATTNGASLEDCLTNIFSLIDLNGIRWKRFKQKESNNFLFTPIDTHPVLTNYAKCCEANHIAAWRNEPQKRHTSGTSGTTGPGGGPGGGGSGCGSGHSNFPTPTRTSNNNTPTGVGPSGLGSANSGGANQNQSGSGNSNNNNTSSPNNYELWVFGYGDQLKVDDVISDDLIEIEDDTWEQKGLSYECRTLLFKALHNLIDRHLTNKGFIRLGRWFVQPLPEHLDHSACCHANSNSSSSSSSSTTTTTITLSSSSPNAQHRLPKHFKSEQTSSIIPPTSSISNIRMSTSNLNLSSTISSTINELIEGYEVPRESLDKTDGLRHTSTRSSNTYFTTSLDGAKSSLSFAFNFFVHGNTTICTTVDVRKHPIVHPLTRADLATFQSGHILRVALAPYGLNGILNGVSYKDSDNGAATTAFIQQWSKFYPLPKTLARLIPTSKTTNSAMKTSSSATNFQKATQLGTPSQFGSGNDSQGARSYLSNLTNMLLPPTNKPPLNFDHEPHEVPPVVEVIVAGHRMRYPSECVFTTSRMTDTYKSVNQAASSIRTNSAVATKRATKSSFIKPNKLSLLSEKSSEDRLDLQARVKIEPSEHKTIQQNLDDSLKTTAMEINDRIMNDGLMSTTVSQSNSNFSATTTATITSTSASIATSNTQSGNNSMLQPSGINDKEKTLNGCPDPEGGGNSLNSNHIAQTTISSRYNSTKIGCFNSTNTPLGPTDLVKLFPTPPSLEQILSPSTIAEESNKASKDSVPSPNDQNTKDNGIDIYKPVECALMPPPPKWAALTNIVIASSRSLPPECIYKSSSQKTSSKLERKFCESPNNSTLNMLNLKSSSKQLNSILDKSKNSPAAPSPLADQTNKNGFNMNSSTPKSFTPNSMIGAANITSPQVFSSNPQAPSSLMATPMTTFSAYTLPHQRLFNNLNEINSIQLNLTISDSALGMFQDHNFENCTLCVCNMSIKGIPPDSIPQRNELDNVWGKQSMGADNIVSPLTTVNEHSNECTCGFSALTNRHYSHLSGLFLEDELEITNILYDPTEMIDQNKLFRKVRLSTYPESALIEEQKSVNRLLESISKTTAVGKLVGEDSIKTSGIKSDKAGQDDRTSQSNEKILEETKLFVIEQLKQHCCTMIHSNTSLSRVLMIEAARNSRHPTNCINYYAQAPSKSTSASPFQKLWDETNKYTTVKMVNRNPCSLKFTDYCEVVKSLITKLDSQGQSQHQNSRLTNTLVKSYHQGNNSNLSSVFARMFGPNRQSMIGKSIDTHGANRNNFFVQGLQALVLPTLTIDPKGTLQMLEQLVRDESKEALATLNKAILIFSSPLHDWAFLTAPVPENNFDAANLLKVLQPMLDDAVGAQNKIYKELIHQKQQNDYTSRDSPSGAPVKPTPPCQGPLTWKQFHHATGRSAEDQCEPQPIPSLLVGYHVDKSHMALSPFALKFWDKLLLEPYAPGHNMYYLVIAPDDSTVLGPVATFFKELSTVYELFRLGKHSPIGNGIVAASGSIDSSKDDGWFAKVGIDERDASTKSVLNKIKGIASQMTPDLVKTIVDFIDERQPPYDPHADRFESSPSAEPKPVRHFSQLRSHSMSQQQTSNRPFAILPGSTNPSMQSSTQPQFSLSSSSSSQQQHQQQQQQHGMDLGFGSFVGENQSLLDNQLNPAIKSQVLINVNPAHNNNEDNTYLEDEANKQSGIVIYMIDPFSSPSTSQNIRTLTTVGLMKCYSMLLNQMPDNLKQIIQLQIISLDSVLNQSRPLVNLSRIDQLKSLSMNVYASCRKIMTNQITAKSLTGFGPAAALEKFFKTKSNSAGLSRMFTTPFILAPMKDKQTELGESYGHSREKSSILFCSYCITEDQRWLLASVTNEKGELSESTVININVVDRMRRPRASVKRAALKKLMEFLVSVMSEWVMPWRLIIGKLGRVGHGELKEWATLLSKRSLLSYTRELNELCRQCGVLPSTETVSILSACLVSLEPDSKLRIMPDQFTSDDRQASFNKSPLSTPEDASATHILVFPTSASIQPNQGNVEDPLVGSGLEDDLNFPLEEGIEDLGVEENMDDLFSACNDLGPFNMGNDQISSHNDTLMSSSNLQMGSVSCGDGAGNHDEILQLLQQPLALGYYLSTAKIGAMPNWFWSTSPHLRTSCPVFLKSALHIHMPYVQSTDDLLHSNVVQSRNCHQLDSHMTTDVLRYVLEGYNSLSWLALNPKTYDRQSCLPVHMQNLLQLYHLIESFS